MGLGLIAPRLGVACSADWASQVHLWLSFFFFLNIYLFIWEQESAIAHAWEWVGGRDRGRKSESTPESPLSQGVRGQAQSQDPEIRTWAETRSQMLNQLSQLGAPLMIFWYVYCTLQFTRHFYIYYLSWFSKLSYVVYKLSTFIIFKIRKLTLKGANWLVQWYVVTHETVQG